MSRDPLKVRHPFFRPKSRRLFTVAACVIWGGIELVMGNTIWFAVFALIAAYLVYQFFVVFDPKDYAPTDPEDKP